MKCGVMTSKPPKIQPNPSPILRSTSRNYDLKCAFVHNDHLRSVSPVDVSKGFGRLYSFAGTFPLLWSSRTLTSHPYLEGTHPEDGGVVQFTSRTIPLVFDSQFLSGSSVARYQQCLSPHLRHPPTFHIAHSDVDPRFISPME